MEAEEAAAGCVQTCPPVPWAFCCPTWTQKSDLFVDPKLSISVSAKLCYAASLGYTLISAVAFFAYLASLYFFGAPLAFVVQVAFVDTTFGHFCVSQ